VSYIKNKHSSIAHIFIFAFLLVASRQVAPSEILHHFIVSANLKNYWTVFHCDNWRIKNQSDDTCYFIVFLIGSTCFGHYCAHHQELATMMLIATLIVSFLLLYVWDWAGVVSGLQPGHYSSLTQHHSREFLMMRTVMPETCWAYKKHNKITNGI